MENHGNVIIKYKELNDRLKPYGLVIHCWGSIAIGMMDKHDYYFANNLDSIQEAEQWVEGFIFGMEKFNFYNASEE